MSSFTLLLLPVVLSHQAVVAIDVRQNQPPASFLQAGSKSQHVPSNFFEDAAPVARTIEAPYDVGIGAVPLPSRFESKRPWSPSEVKAEATRALSRVEEQEPARLPMALVEAPQKVTAPAEQKLQGESGENSDDSMELQLALQEEEQRLDLQKKQGAQLRQLQERQIQALREQQQAQLAQLQAQQLKERESLQENLEDDPARSFVEEVADAAGQDPGRHGAAQPDPPAKAAEGKELPRLRFDESAREPEALLASSDQTSGFGRSVHDGYDARTGEEGELARSFQVERLKNLKQIRFPGLVGKGQLQALAPPKAVEERPERSPATLAQIKASKVRLEEALTRLQALQQAKEVWSPKVAELQVDETHQQLNLQVEQELAQKAKEKRLLAALQEHQAEVDRRVREAEKAAQQKALEVDGSSASLAELDQIQQKLEAFIKDEP